MCIQNLVGHSVKLLYRGVPFVGDLITIDVEANTMLINCHQLSGSLYQIQHFNYSIKQLNSFVQLPINGIEWIAKCSNISDEAIFFPQEMGYTNFVINCFNCAKPVTFVPCQPEDEAKFIIIGGNKLDFIHDKQLKDPLDSFPINCNMCMSDGILPPTVSNSPSHLILSDLEKYGPRKILQNLSAYPPFNVEFHVDAFVDECSSASALDNTFPSGEPYESPSSTEDIPVAEEHLNVKRVSVGKLPSTTFRDVKEKGQINPKKSQKKVTWRPFISTSIPEAKASPPQQKTMSYGNMPSSSLGAYPKTAPKKPLDKMRKKKKHSRVFRKNASNE